MFDTAYRMVLSKVGVYADQSGPTVVRRVWMEVEREFDPQVARDLGEAAVDSRQHLADQALKKAVLPIDAIETEATLTGLRSSVRVERCRGVKLTAKAGRIDKESGTSEPPSMVIEFDFPYSPDVWVFLGDNAAAYVDVTLTRVQLSLLDRSGTKPAVEATPAPAQEAERAKKGSKKKADEEKPPGLGDFAVKARGRRIEIAEDDEDENQVADTPEEAEEMRSARMADEETDVPAPTTTSAEEGLAF